MRKPHSGFNSYAACKVLTKWFSCICLSCVLFHIWRFEEAGHTLLWNKSLLRAVLWANFATFGKLVCTFMQKHMHTFLANLLAAWSVTKGNVGNHSLRYVSDIMDISLWKYYSWGKKFERIRNFAPASNIWEELHHLYCWCWPVSDWVTAELSDLDQKLAKARQLLLKIFSIPNCSL